jgi:hypothetical protein
MAGQNFDDKLKSTQQDVERLNLITMAVIIVLFIGFAAIFAGYGTTFITNRDSQQATYQALLNQVQVQNAQIQILTNQIKNSTVTPK